MNAKKIFENLKSPEWRERDAELTKKLSEVVGELIAHQGYPGGFSAEMHFHTENDRCVTLHLDVGDAAVAH